jgi:hypothetical protein
LAATSDRWQAQVHFFSFAPDKSARISLSLDSKLLNPRTPAFNIFAFSASFGEIR